MKRIWQQSEGMFPMKSFVCNIFPCNLQSNASPGGYKHITFVVGAEDVNGRRVFFIEPGGSHYLPFCPAFYADIFILLFIWNTGEKIIIIYGKLEEEERERGRYLSARYINAKAAIKPYFVLPTEHQIHRGAMCILLVATHGFNDRINIAQLMSVVVAVIVVILDRF